MGGGEGVGGGRSVNNTFYSWIKLTNITAAQSNQFYIWVAINGEPFREQIFPVTSMTDVNENNGLHNTRAMNSNPMFTHTYLQQGLIKSNQASEFGD